MVMLKVIMSVSNKKTKEYLTHRRNNMKTFRLIGAGLLAVLLSFTFTACSGDDDDDDGNNDSNTQYAVDLGLPSGTLWADRNIGADSPEDCGEYFAWGETEPKSVYDWSTYKWSYGSEHGNITKYCTDCNDDYDYGYNGFTDGKTTLEPADDAATANWGKKWCMPTYDQLNELNTKCTWTWTTLNRVKGYKVTGPNGSSIFLPAVGFRYDSEFSPVGSYGYCWSSSLDDGYPVDAWCLNFSSGDHYLSYYSERSEGLSVRAVVR